MFLFCFLFFFPGSLEKGERVRRILKKHRKNAYQEESERIVFLSVSVYFGEATFVDTCKRKTAITGCRTLIHLLAKAVS